MINNDNINNEVNDDNYLVHPKNNLFNMNNNYLTNRIENKYQGINKYKHFSRQNVSPFIKNRKMMAYTDNRNNIKNNYNFDEFENNNNEGNQEYIEDQMDLSQKKYLENYKTFLSSLDQQLNK